MGHLHHIFGMSGLQLPPDECPGREAAVVIPVAGPLSPGLEIQIEFWVLVSILGPTLAAVGILESQLVWCGVALFLCLCFSLQ